MPTGTFRLNTTSKPTEARHAPAEIYWSDANVAQTYVTGRYANAIELPAVAASSFVTQTYPNADFLFNSAHAWTVEWFCRRTGNITSGTSSLIRQFPVNTMWIQVSQGSVQNTLRVFVNNVAITSNIPLTATAGEWDHWALQSTGTGLLEIYVNGLRQAQVTYTQLANTTAWNFRNFLGLGSAIQLDEIRMSTCVRYHGESYDIPTVQFTDDTNVLALHHLNNSVIDDFQRRDRVVLPTRSVILGNSTTPSSLYDSSITRNTPTNNTGSTVSIWVRPLGPVSGSARSEALTILNFNNTDGNNAAYFLQARNNRTLRLYRHFGGGLGFEDSANFVTNAFPVWNQWYHIAIAIDSVLNVCKCYINGIKQTPTINVRTDRNQGWHILTGIQVGGRLTTNAVAGLGDAVAQLWANDQYIDLDTEIHKFYRDGYVNMGVDGTGSGLPRPLIFHDGNTTPVTGTMEYRVNGGRNSGSFLTYNLTDNQFGTITNG